MKQTLNIKGAALILGNVLTLKLAGQSDIEAAGTFCNEFRQDKQYAAVVGEVTKRRTLTQNGYCWKLLNLLGEKLNRPAVDIYRELIKDVPGACDVYSMPTAAVPIFARHWTKGSYGAQVQTLAESCGLSTIQCWYGSSDYDTKQMARLIDLVVQECQQQGIPTMTPDEIARLEGLNDA